MRILLVFILLSLSPFIHAQKNSYVMSGTVMVAGSDQAIDYATIVAKDKTTGEIISGTTSANGGMYNISTHTENVSLEVSFIGFKPAIINEVEFKDNFVDLGVIELTEDTKELDEVIVATERSTVEFKLDKRVFNVGTNLSSSGASALEVLNNVPSVNVNIEGAITLRGSSGVQILIDGKPTILAEEGSNALGTITADMISQVEVITNPSAKYEAEGTAGIINIVLKKEDKNGLNGSVTFNSGVPHNHSIGLSMNRRTEKFNIFSQLGVGHRELPRYNENINLDKIENTELRSTGVEYRNETFYNFILGSDYYINPQNVITLSGSYAYEIEDQPSETDYTFKSEQTTESVWTREEVTEATNPKIQYELQYKSDFDDDEDHQLLFSAVGRFFGKDQSSVFTNEIAQGADSLSLNNQITTTEFEEGSYTFKIDYTKPFNDKWEIETGAHYLIHDVSNNFSVSDDMGGEFVLDTGLTNQFDYDQKVLGLYGTGSFEGDLWGLKLGLRVEDTDLTTLLVNTNEDNSQKFTNLFPSAHSSYKLSEAVSVQVSYSRRIYRPRMWDLNPFFNIRNSYSIRAGNPKLQPEFTDSYEAGSIFLLGKMSFNINAYYRYTTDKIERVSAFENNINTYRPENVGTNKATGLEANFKYSPFKKISFNGDANYNIFKREGTFNNQTFNFSADYWSGKLTTKYRLNKAIDIEIIGHHESAEKTVQGTIGARTFADLGLKIKILDGRGVFNCSVRDVFASRVRQSTINNEDYYLYSHSQQGRFVALGFSYGFGKGEAMQYTGGRRR